MLVPGFRGPNRNAACAYVIAVIFAAAIGYDLLRMPVQVYDSVDEILDAQASPSALASFRTALVEDKAHLRPLRIAQTKILFDLADGEYRLAYRGFHAALLMMCFLLFTRTLRVRTATDAAAAIVALTVLMGLHTFRGTVQEAFPVNHFLEVVVACLLTVNLAQSRGGFWVDGAAAVTFAVAALTLESGLLVWVVAVAAYVSGMRGISLRGLILMTALFAAYVYLRLVYLSMGTPARFETGSGYLLDALEPSELQARFGDRPFVFYAYNIAASALSVLFSEPQNGIFVGIRSWVSGELPPRVWMAVGSSTVTTALVVWAAVCAIRRRARRGNHARILLVSAAVLAGSAAMSSAYTKDAIMTTAGAFYALAAYVAVRGVLHRAPRARPAVATLVAVLLLSTAAAWTVRSIGIHHVLRTQAFKHRNDWAMLPALWEARGRWPDDPAARELTLRLRNDALGIPAPNPRFEPRWAYRLWGE